MITREQAIKLKKGDRLYHVMDKDIHCIVTGVYIVSKTKPEFTIHTKLKGKEFFVTENNKFNWKL